MLYKKTPESFEELLAPLPDEIQKLATLIRDCISEVLPEADENFYGGEKMGMTLYSMDNPNSVFCGIQPTESMCKLFFHGWQELKRKGYNLEGSGKNARHIKLRSLSDYDSDTLLEMLKIVKEELT
jgi:hypothetical protein